MPKENTILIVDDQPENLRVLLEILKDDFKVIGATSGQKALELSLSQQPDIILLDVFMPEMDGYEVCRQLKTNPTTQPIPIIFLSSISEIEGKDTAQQLGAAGHLTKPIDPHRLKEEIYQHLETPSSPHLLNPQPQVSKVPKKEKKMEDKPRVLIVDDQPENLQILIESLKHLYAITVATSGPKALAMLAKEPYPDLILLDIIMPDMNGFELCKRIKQRSEIANIPVIFITVMEAVEDIMMGFQLGGVDYIIKPYRIEEVKARITTHIKLQHEQKKLAQALTSLQESQALNLQQARINASGQLMRNIAHQWRQPLTFISFEIDTVLSELNSHETLPADYLKQKLINAQETIKKMSQLISEFSQLFKPSEEIGTFPIGDVIDQALRVMQAEIEESDLVIARSGEANILCTGYSSETTRIVMFIISNALDIFKTREIPEKKIWITYGQQANGIRLSLEDNAGGIDEEILSCLFEPYASTKFQSFGVGLNLFIAKIVIEKHMKGSLLVENTEQGARFHIDLPCER